MTPDEYCQQKAAASGSSFYYSFLFLPPERRRAITALYAFCREVDDVVDETEDLQLAATKLAWWRAELANFAAGNAQHPVTKALAPFQDSFSISVEKLNQIIDGMEMDLTQTRYLDWPGLERYCYHVASVVGLLAAGIFGYRDARTLDYARELGIAFQLTNIIRDVGEDARKNRIYLPIDDLKRFGVPAADILQAKETPAFRELMAFEAARAREHYGKAMQALPAQDRKAQRPGLVMAAIYRTLLDEIESDGWRVLTQRTSLTPLRKLWIAWKTWISA
ncbi:MAG TPA: presqualene diphosphate synthase HpnD [Burkholderiales bacterium]|nr:presqualene diphosphate synthase HpnD [Burkholderiales bacterium]